MLLSGSWGHSCQQPHQPRWKRISRPPNTGTYVMAWPTSGDESYSGSKHKHRTANSHRQLDQTMLRPVQTCGSRSRRWRRRHHALTISLLAQQTMQPTLRSCSVVVQANPSFQFAFLFPNCTSLSPGTRPGLTPLEGAPAPTVVLFALSPPPHPPTMQRLSVVQSRLAPFWASPGHDIQDSNRRLNHHPLTRHRRLSRIENRCKQLGLCVVRLQDVNPQG